MEQLEGDAQKNIRRGALCAFLLSLVAVFALHCHFEVVAGEPQSSALVDWLHRAYGSFSSPEFTDLFAFAAVFAMLRFVGERDRKMDVGCLVLSFALSLTLVVSISFKKFNSLVFLQANGYQLWLSGFCIAGFWIILYALIRCACHWFDKSVTMSRGDHSFLEKHFLAVGFCVIFLGWMPWILMNYPGSGCGDSVMQLRQFLGEIEWDAAHPVLSTVVMGGLFSLGRMAADANFGFFLYCLMQTCAGAWVFSFGMKKLKDLGLPAKWCLAGLAWFALTPLWGTYAQWVEKDLFYTEVALLQTICMLEILAREECGRREMALLVGSSLGTAFLRTNGIVVVLPALAALAVRFRGRPQGKRITAALLIVLITYGGAVKGLYPILGIKEASKVDVFNIPFQQTSRYVYEYGGEVTEHEREVLEKVFVYEYLGQYNPTSADPVKCSYRGADLGEYLGVWARMFWKHPGTYLSAFLNNNYGYLAPVMPNIEGWVQLEYYDYLKELGIRHVFDREVSNVLMMVWNLSMTMPLAKYLCTPGMYTWLVAVLAMMLIRRRKAWALILFIPSFMTIVSCLVSSLTGAIRYELQVVASAPLLIGWTYLSLHEQMFAQIFCKKPIDISGGEC